MKATTTMRTIHHAPLWAIVIACTLIMAACGNDDEADNGLPGSAPTTLTPEQTQEPNLPSIDGYLISATTENVVLRTGDGDQTFTVDEQDAPAIGIEHLASHAGINTLGFRVFYERQGDRRFVKQAVEIPPPALEGTE